MKYLTYAKYIAIVFIVILALIGINALRMYFFPPSVQTNIRMSPTTVIKEIRELSRFETASFTIEKVIEAGQSGNAFSSFLFGDRILLIAHGEVIAGFDLSTLSDKDVYINGQNIRLTLPAPKVLITSLDNQQTRVYDRRKGVLTEGDKDLESKARLAAQQAITDAACKGGILDQASQNARKQLSALLKTFGYTNVIIDIPQGSC